MVSPHTNNSLTLPLGLFPAPPCSRIPVAPHHFFASLAVRHTPLRLTPHFPVSSSNSLPQPDDLSSFFIIKTKPKRPRLCPLPLSVSPHSLLFPAAAVGGLSPVLQGQPHLCLPFCLPAVLSAGGSSSLSLGTGSCFGELSSPAGTLPCPWAFSALPILHVPAFVGPG